MSTGEEGKGDVTLLQQKLCFNGCPFVIEENLRV